MNLRLACLAMAAALGYGAWAAENRPPTVYQAPPPAPARAPSAAAAPATAPATNSAAAPKAVPPPAAPAAASAADLETLAMPIALHPDPLIAVILPASVYPVEIVQAARFVKDTNNVAKLDAQPWDENVKAVARFPDLIAKMDADLEWTVKLGQAFLEQPKELMDAIQALRAKAQQAGTLRSSPQQVVSVTNVVVVQTNVTQVVNVTNQVVQIVPSNPQVIYVPTYTSTVYYPPPGYVYDPWAPLVSFGVGMAVGAIIANNCDWHHGGIYVGHHGFVAWGGGYGDVDIDIDNEINIDRGDRPDRGSGDRASNTSARTSQQKWQPDQNRLRSSGAPATAQTREARGWSGTGAQPAQRPAQQPAGGLGAARPAQQPARNPGVAQSPVAAPRPSTPAAQPSVNRPASPAGQASVNRPASAQPSVNRAAPQASARPQPSSAFSGVNNGAGARSASSRGAVSRGGGGGGGMRGGGGRR